MKIILVPLDGSGLAEQALVYARMLAPLMSARIRLLHVVTDVDARSPLAYDISTLYSLSDVIAAQQERHQQSWQAVREHAEGYLASGLAQVVAVRQRLRPVGLVLVDEGAVAAPEVLHADPFPFQEQRAVMPRDGREQQVAVALGVPAEELA